MGAVLTSVAIVAVLWIADAGAAPGCSAQPSISADGTTVYGTPCSDSLVVKSKKVDEVIGGEGDDVIAVNPEVAVIIGGGGDDTIYGELPETKFGSAESTQPTVSSFRRLSRRASERHEVATISSPEQKWCTKEVSCYGGLGSQELIGSSGNDKIFGQRGNDILKGHTGDDKLYGGIGDESIIEGNAGNDILAGGLGTDDLDGGPESDIVRGDGTIDDLADSGASGTDTLSFATGSTPGFTGAIGVTGFPADGNSEERGVYIRLDGVEGLCGNDLDNQPLESCNNDARYGGGSDHIAVAGFENVIGSPFADVIYGSSIANRIDGGGGADVIYGKEGNDQLYGGADGDLLKGEGGSDTAVGQGGTNNCVEAETLSGCSGSSEAVKQRDRSKISVGFMVTEHGGLTTSQLYMTGSTSRDVVNAGYYVTGGTGHVMFWRSEASAPFDGSSDAQTAGCVYETWTVDCTLAYATDALVMAGMGGNDELSVGINETFWETTSPILTGGEGNDVVTGTATTEDLLIDGPGTGEDTLRADGNDDALINNEGKDILEGGLGNDLLLSGVNCEGDTLDGASASLGDGAGENSASWAKYAGGRIVADLKSSKAGNGWSGPAISCSSGSPATLLRLDDLEGTSFDDELYGDSNANNLFSRKGADIVFGREGNDRIEAQDEATKDSGNGGTHTTADVCVVDAGEKASFSNCETFVVQ